MCGFLVHQEARSWLRAGMEEGRWRCEERESLKQLSGGVGG